MRKKPKHTVINNKDIRMMYYKDHIKVIRHDMEHLNAAISLILHREYGWDADQIAELVEKVGDMWRNYNGEHVLKLCEEETGLIYVPGDKG